MELMSGYIMKLNNKNIIDDVKGVRFIRYSQSKTNKQVDVPIHQDVKDILEKRSGFPKPISDQRFNDYIKLVCKGSGINEVIYGSKTKGERGLRRTGYFEKWELIKSHTCRRTFATIHYKKLNNKIIMSVTGHTSEKMFLKYIGETENEHLEDFMNLWNKK